MSVRHLFWPRLASFPASVLMLLASGLSLPLAAIADDVPPDTRILKDLPYVENGHERQRLDLYLPASAGSPRPVIVWIHGGGWHQGSKNRCPAIGLTARGFAVASINYRLTQHAIFPAQIHDCKAAIRWLRAHADEYELDRERIGAWGSSAGGHLVALLGTTGNRPELEGELGHLDQSSGVQAAVDWFGPTDFLTVGPKDTRTKLIGGDPLEHRVAARRASPVTYVSAAAAPFLIMHGADDPTVPVAQSETFAAALRSAGASPTLVIVPGAGHGGPKFSSPEVRQEVERFFVEHLQKPPAPSTNAN